MIVAVTHERDDHAPALFAALERVGADVTILDLAELPRHGTVSAGFGGYRCAPHIHVAGRDPIHAEAVTSVWWRRPRLFVAAPGLTPEQAGYSVRHTTEAVMGFFAALRDRCVNDPWLSEIADHKPYQLAVAQGLGLPVPRTLVSSDVDEVRAFLREVGRDHAIHKALTTTAGTDGRPTRRVTAEDLERLASVRHAPTIFQERVDGIDIRVTVVGDALFAASIDARGSSSQDDFRYAYGCTIRHFELPAALADALRGLMRALGLVYAAIDLRPRSDGEFAFLEVNPAGQWLFVEDQTEQPITASLAELLARSP